MRLALLILSILGLSGCVATNGPLPQAMQSHFIGKPIRNVEQRLGPPDRVNKEELGTRYIWSQRQTRWITSAPSQKIAGTRMVNGRNVATTVSGPPVRTLQSVSCSVIVTTNNAGAVTQLEQSSAGLGCSDLISKLQ